MEAALGWIIALPLIVLIVVVAFIPFAGPLLVSLVAAGAGFYTFLVSGHMVGQLLRTRSGGRA